jgi:hypothetical protein
MGHCPIIQQVIRGRVLAQPHSCKRRDTAYVSPCRPRQDSSFAGDGDDKDSRLGNWKFTHVIGDRLPGSLDPAKNIILWNVKIAGTKIDLKCCAAEMDDL